MTAAERIHFSKKSFNHRSCRSLVAAAQSAVVWKSPPSHTSGCCWPLTGIDSTITEQHTCRYGLVRVRENAESIAFYRGEASETRLLFQRLQAVVENYISLIVTSRNLEFFTSFYRCPQALPLHIKAGQTLSIT